MNSDHITVFSCIRIEECVKLKFNYIIARCTTGRRAEAVERTSLTTHSINAEHNRKNHKLYHYEASEN